MDFLKECVLYIGGAFGTLVDGLNKVQAKAFEEFVKANPSPTKGPKKAAAKPGDAAAC